MISFEIVRILDPLWFPKKLGGEGFLRDRFVSNSRQLPWYKKLVRNDIGGATVAVFKLGGAIALGAVPGANTVIGTSIAVSAEGASAVGAFWD